MSAVFYEADWRYADALLQEHEMENIFYADTDGYIACVGVLCR